MRRAHSRCSRLWHAGSFFLPQFPIHARHNSFVPTQTSAETLVRSLILTMKNIGAGRRQQGGNLALRSASELLEIRIVDRHQVRSRAQPSNRHGHRRHAKSYHRCMIVALRHSRSLCSMRTDTTTVMAAFFLALNHNLLFQSNCSLGTQSRSFPHLRESAERVP